MRHTLLLLLLLSSCPAAHAANPIPVYSMHYPPLHMAPGQARQADGLGDDLVRRAASLAGLQVSIHTVPWARAQLMAQQQRQACVFPLTRLPARETQYQWIGQITSGKLQLYGWHDAPRLPDTTAAANYRITVLAGSSAELRLQQHQLPYISTNQESDGLRLLQLGKTDYWAVHDVVARYEAQKARLRLVPALSLGDADSWLACHRAFPATQRLAWQQAFVRLHASGEASQIRLRYLADPVPDTSSDH